MVRRLLHATPGVASVSVRAGDGIGLPGFDGRADASVSSVFVPSGPSVWELGTGVDALGKADEDFRKRTANPGDVDPTSATFVAVSMRRVADKDNWVAARIADGRWRDVRMLDADDLHGWLEASPAVHIWASEQLGLRPLEVATLETWWSTWSTQTRPPTPSALILAGRDKESAKLRELLSEGPRVLGVYASSTEEATAFVVAALLESSGASLHDEPVMPTGLVISTPHSWGRLAAGASGLVLVPEFSAADVEAAVGAGNAVVVPMGPGSDRRRADLDLPRIGREGARDALRGAGLDLDSANRGSVHARRSLASFRRTRAANPAVQAPAWAAHSSAGSLAPLVLVGSWSLTRVPDHLVVAAVAGCPYDTVERELRALAATADPPFVASGDSWQLSAPEDAWAQLGPALTRHDLDLWRAQAIEVLGEPDPVLDLPLDEQHLAGLHDLARVHSSTLRDGLARGVALMGVAPGDGPDGRPWSEHALRLVAEVLDPGDLSTWIGLANALPSLAEASPEAFLRAVAATSTGQEPLLRGMFTDSDERGIWESRSPHTGLLWALELLCWSEQYAAEACEALARLAEIDPGGRLGNRPAASLRRVLLPWFPQTGVPLDGRLEVVAGLLDRRPEVGWRLLLGLLPQFQDNSIANFRPTFRDWKSTATTATVAETLAASHAMVNLALKQLTAKPELWAEFVESIATLPPDDLARVLDALEELDPVDMDEGPRLSIWVALEGLVRKHRRFPTAQWVLPDTSLSRLEAIATSLEPTEAPERNARLFDWHPDLPGIDPLDHTTYDKALAQARRSAIAQVLTAGEPARLSELIAASPVPEFVGVALAEVAGAECTNRMFGYLDADGPQRRAASGWTVRMVDLHGDPFVKSSLARAQELTGRARVLLYLGLPNGPVVWETVDRETEELQNEYWQRLPVKRVPQDDLAALIERLLDRGRPWSAVDLLAQRCHDPAMSPALELIERALRSAAESSEESPGVAGAVDYDVGVLLDRLQVEGAADHVLAELEWVFFGILQHTREPSNLYADLARHPASFVQLVCSAYRAANEPERDLDDAAVALARQSFLVLRAWCRPPGLAADGSFDDTVLHDWVAEARALLDERGRGDIGDECIGAVLSGAPVGDDGIWPAEPVRKLLETSDGASLGQGLAMGRFNSRGVMTRGVFEGGRQEEALADQYEDWSKRVMARWPVTGRLLREMATSYRSWARLQDVQAERWSDSG